MGLRRRANASHNPDDQSISGYLQCDAENGPPSSVISTPMRQVGIPWAIKVARLWRQGVVAHASRTAGGAAQ
jgi:hypothetical protein